MKDCKHNGIDLRNRRCLRCYKDLDEIHKERSVKEDKPLIECECSDCHGMFMSPIPQELCKACDKK